MKRVYQRIIETWLNIQVQLYKNMLGIHKITNTVLINGQVQQLFLLEFACFPAGGLQTSREKTKKRSKRLFPIPAEHRYKVAHKLSWKCGKSSSLIKTHPIGTFILPIYRYRFLNGFFRITYYISPRALARGLMSAKG